MLLDENEAQELMLDETNDKMMLPDKHKGHEMLQAEMAMHDLLPDEYTHKALGMLQAENALHELLPDEHEQEVHVMLHAESALHELLLPVKNEQDFAGPGTASLGGGFAAAAIVSRQESEWDEQNPTEKGEQMMENRDTGASNRSIILDKI